MHTTLRVVSHRALGALTLEVADGHLTRVTFDDLPPPDRGDDPAADRAAAWLRAYLDGDDAPPPIPVAPAGTPFQRRVWDAIAGIPWGQTRTYGDLAVALGTAPRAVGRATGANPNLIVVPCHRVVSASGVEVGYAGGLARKRWLIDHERAASALRSR